MNRTGRFQPSTMPRAVVLPIEIEPEAFAPRSSPVVWAFPPPGPLSMIMSRQIDACTSGESVPHADSLSGLIPNLARWLTYPGQAFGAVAVGVFGFHDGSGQNASLKFVGNAWICRNCT